MQRKANIRIGSSEEGAPERKVRPPPRVRDQSLPYRIHTPTQTYRLTELPGRFTACGEIQSLLTSFRKCSIRLLGVDDTLNLRKSPPRVTFYHYLTIFWLFLTLPIDLYVYSIIKSGRIFDHPRFSIIKLSFHKSVNLSSEL